MTAAWRLGVLVGGEGGEEGAYLLMLSSGPGVLEGPAADSGGREGGARGGKATCSTGVLEGDGLEEGGLEGPAAVSVTARGGASGGNATAATVDVTAAGSSAGRAGGRAGG